MLNNPQVSFFHRHITSLRAVFGVVYLPTFKQIQTIYIKKHKRSNALCMTVLYGCKNYLNIIN